MSDSSQLLKEKGNNYYKNKEYYNAIECYTQSIKIDKNNSILYSNRAACYSSINNYTLSLYDSLKSIELNPEYFKSYLRAYDAYVNLERYSDALLLIFELQKIDIKREINITDKINYLKSKLNKGYNIDLGELIGLLSYLYVNKNNNLRKFKMIKNEKNTYYFDTIKNENINCETSIDDYIDSKIDLTDDEKHFWFYKIQYSINCDTYVGYTLKIIENLSSLGYRFVYKGEEIQNILAVNRFCMEIDNSMYEFYDISDSAHNNQILIDSSVANFESKLNINKEKYGENHFIDEKFMDGCKQYSKKYNTPLYKLTPHWWVCAKLKDKYIHFDICNYSFNNRDSHITYFNNKVIKSPLYVFSTPDYQYMPNDSLKKFYLTLYIDNFNTRRMPDDNIYFKNTESDNAVEFTTLDIYSKKKIIDYCIFSNLKDEILDYFNRKIALVEEYYIIDGLKSKSELNNNKCQKIIKSDYDYNDFRIGVKTEKIKISIKYSNIKPLKNNNIKQYLSYEDMKNNLESKIENNPEDKSDRPILIKTIEEAFTNPIYIEGIQIFLKSGTILFNYSNNSFKQLMNLLLEKGCYSGEEKRLCIVNKHIADHKKFDKFIEIWTKLTKSGIDNDQLKKIEKDDPEIEKLINLALENCGHVRK